MCGGGGFSVDEIQYNFRVGASGTSNLTASCKRENGCDELFNLTQEFIDDIFKSECAKDDGTLVNGKCPAPYNSYANCEMSAMLYKKMVYEPNYPKERCDMVGGKFRPSS